MKPKIFLAGLFILLIITFVSCSVSRRITEVQQSPTEETFLSDKINLQEYENKYSEHNGVYLLVKNVYEHSGSNNPYDNQSWSYHKVSKYKYLVLNPDDEDLTTFTISLHPKAKINSLYLISLSPSGEIKRYDKNDLYIETDSYGYLTYKFSFPGIIKGSIIEKGIDLTYNAYEIIPPIEYNIDLQFLIPCENLEFDFAYPDWWQINTKKIKQAEYLNFNTTLNKNENKKIITYRAQNVPAIIPEPFSPFFYEVAKYLQMRITNLDAGVKYNAPKSWREFAIQFRKFAMNNEGIFSTLVRSTTNDITEKYTTQYEKFEAIVSYVQQNIETSKDYKERDFPDVIEDRQGNIFEICGLTQAMLSKADIQTDYLLIHSATDGHFDESYISSAQFYVPGIRADIDNTSYVVLPFLKNLPVNHIPEFIQNQQALIISNDITRNGTFWTLPTGNMAENNFKEKFDITILSDGAVSVIEEKLLEGSFAYDIREYLSKLKDDEVKGYIQENLIYDEGNVQLNSYEIINTKSYKHPLIFKLEYSINNLITITPDEIIFLTSGLLSPSSLRKFKIDPKDRVNPIKISYNQTYEKDININFPVQWGITTNLTDTEQKNDLGSFKEEFKYSEGKLKIKQVSKYFKCFKPKDQIKKLLTITGIDFNVPALIFSTKTDDNRIPTGK
jgi:hypothetical protein